MTIADVRNLFRDFENKGMAPTLLHMEERDGQVERFVIANDQKTLMRHPKSFRPRFPKHRLSSFQENVYNPMCVFHSKKATQYEGLIV